VAKTVPHRSEPPDQPVQFARLRIQLIAMDAGLAVGREHSCDLLEGKPSGAAKGDERKLLHYPRLEEPSKAASPDRSDEPLLFVEAQRGRRRSRAPRHFRNVEILHA
jgi:hypothetical protein